MISKRRLCAAVMMENKWLYALMGDGSDGNSERIDVQICSKWEGLNIPYVYP